MKKNLDTTSIASELTGSSVYFRNPEPKSKVVTVKPEKQSKKQKPKKKLRVKQSTNQSTGQSTSRSTNKPVNSFDNIDEIGAIVARPKAFYITERLDEMLNDAVKHLQDNGIHKVDRSVLLNAILHDPEIFKPKQLDKLRGRILVHLANKSLRRV